MMLFYHPLRKTFDDFNEVHRYILVSSTSSTEIETDSELVVGQIIMLSDISMNAFVVVSIWIEDGQNHVLCESAESKIVRARLAKD
ncbi:hypothetical protein [Paenibacillus polymyxa]|uniref:hypothetical protein n=1 Tax=Paenibacillus polymyxa TaxID=1406 RepID=UPI002378B6D5|nr:hypothetical protein [Paenibacillus polymyxa]WDM21281.1 hypothetical protein J4I02_20285 [Paenibacillus polymyxa]